MMMDLRGIKQHVAALQEQIDKAEKTAQELLDMGVEKGIARSICPHPESQIYLDKMNRLTAMIDRGDIVDKQEALREVYECAYYSTGWKGEDRMRYAAATTICLSIFGATSEEITEAYLEGRADKEEKESE